MQSYPQLSWLSGLFCRGDGLFGLSPLEFAGFLAIFNFVLFVPVWLAWRVASHKFNGSGFSNGVWRGWIYVVLGFAILQDVIWLSHPIIGDAICPYDHLFLYSSVPIAILYLYGYHLWTGNAGRFSRFVALIALPIVFEISGIGGVKTGITVVKGGWEFLGYIFDHVAPLLRL